MAKGTYSYTGTIQKVTVGTTGIYDITAYGAQGGSAVGAPGGAGAEVGGSFSLTAGERLEIVVGGAGAYGSTNPGYGDGGGGGGGSFVLESTDGGATYHLLIAAGGGGGGYHSAGANASYSSAGSGAGGGSGGGPNGPDHTKPYLSGGGGSGYKGDGYTGRGVGGSNRTGGYAGGAQQASGTYTGHGGFGGGGGGSEFGAGGGGGYSGGSGGYYVGGGHTSGRYSGGAGGGTSIDHGTPIVAKSAATENAAHNGNGEVLISPAIACYRRGTLIRAARGDVPVERLEIGDLLVTRSGEAKPIKWIGRRSYGGRFVAGRKDILPVCIRAGALGDDVPLRDLWISPQHAMYLDGLLIEAKDLVNGISIVQAESVENVEYFHIELDRHDVIIAEGAASETFIDDDSRGMFHNAHEFHARYPDEVAPAAVCYCAPRLEDGFEVEEVRCRLAARAGLWREADAQRLGVLNGHVEAIGSSRIAGWAQTDGQPEAPVCLDIYAGGQLIGQVLANRYRDDLERAHHDGGRHGFEFTPPPGLPFAPEAIEVRRSLDGSVLGVSAAAGQARRIARR